MKLMPEARALTHYPEVRKVVTQARQDSHIAYREISLADNDRAEVMQEGKYPLVSKEGNFEATLLRVIPADHAETTFRGGEFRILANEALSSGRVAESNELHVVVDSIPLFLKELSDTGVQNQLSQSRRKVSGLSQPAALVQNRASDMHDGEYRIRADGQLDLQEEIWYSKVLNVMSMFPGMDAVSAKQVLVKIGEKPYLTDYSLGTFALINHYRGGNFPDGLTVEFIEGDQFLQPFGAAQSFNIDEIILTQGEDIRNSLTEKMKPRIERTVLPNGRDFVGTTLASYPIIQDGVKFDVQLVSIKEQGDSFFHTFRMLGHGDLANAYVRIDSICANGIQGGDSHCDCRKQSEIEKGRAGRGDSMILINIRDHEGRAHGEGLKGGTLATQRGINSLIRQNKLSHINKEIGNGTASQLFYHNSGEQADARDYSTTQALIRYMHMDYIPFFVTDNVVKIKAIEAVSTVGSFVSAEVVEGLSQEAQDLYVDKKGNNIPGVVYQFG
jgi:hypothetical protein